jgi:tetratricopeptide (TPR) repeat protein
MLAYLLLRGSDRTKERIVEWFGEDGDHSSRRRHPLPQSPYWAANSVYDYIRFLDTNFRYKKALNMSLRNNFFDPLVSYRVAGLAVERREFPRAIEILDEAVRHRFFEKFQETELGNLRVLNHARFERRCGQYSWLAYLANRQENANSLYEAIERMKKVLSMKPSDLGYTVRGTKSQDLANKLAGILKHEQDWAGLNLVLYSFYRYVLNQEGVSNYTAFYREVEALSQPRLPQNKKVYSDIEGQKFLIKALYVAQKKKARAIELIQRAIVVFDKSPRRFETALDRLDVAHEILTFIESIKVAD